MLPFSAFDAKFNFPPLEILCRSHRDSIQTEIETHERIAK